MKRITLLSPSLLFALFGVTLAQPACQEVAEPTVVLTQQQWKEVEQHILKEEPSPQHKLNINFDNEIELIGMDISPAPIKAGEDLEVTWYWRCKKATKQNLQVFGHLDAAGEQMRQSLDHYPVNGLYRTSMWKPGQIIRDVQKLKLREDFPAGEAVLYLGLYQGNGLEGRKLVVNEAPKTNDRRAIGPKLQAVAGTPGAVKAPASDSAASGKPRYAMRQLNAEEGAITVDGRLDEAVWAGLQPARLAPFGDKQKYETWVKLYYTDDALYVGAYMEDKHAWGTLKERDANTWEEEVFELFLDVDGDGKDYLELQVTPNNVVFDANFKERLGRGEGSREEQIDRARAWNMEGLETGVFVDGTVNDAEKEDKFWTIELKLPFSSLPGAGGAAPKPGSRWAVNFYRFDRPAQGQSYAYAWSQAARGDFHAIEHFGELRFAPRIDIERLRALQQRDAQGAPATTKPIKGLSPLNIKQIKQGGKSPNVDLNLLKPNRPDSTPPTPPKP